MEETFRCPRCNFEQPQTDACRHCGVNIPRYIDLQRTRNIVPTQDAQKRREEAKQKPESRISEHKKTPPNEPIAFPGPTDTGIAEKKSIGTKDGLSRISDLFSKTWDIFKRRSVSLVALYLLTIVFFALVFGVFFGAGYLLSTVFPDAKLLLLATSGLIGGAAGSIAMFWGLAAVICAVSDETLGIRESLEAGSKKLWSFIWIFTILSYIVTGGFLLVIIPGIIFSIWFFFSQFILAREDERGMNALLKSKEYVKGYWFDVFLRMFIIWIISAVISGIPFIGWILSLFFIPFAMIFSFLVYEDLKAIKGDVPYVSSSGEKLKWIGAGTLGYIVVPFLLIVFLGASVLTSVFLLTGMMKSPGQQITVPHEFTLSPPQPQESQETPSSPIQDQPAHQQFTPPPPQGGGDVPDILVYIYSLNYKGSVSVNGEKVYEIKGEKDMNYNYTGDAKFRYGKNILDVDYASLPTPWKVELNIKVYRRDWQSGKDDIINEWTLNDKGGRKSFEVTITR
jgi:hypothetical protein